jgi:acetyl esterase/lipase
VGAAAFSPWADLTLKGETHVSRAEADPFVTREVLQHFAELYLQGADPTDPTASPLYGPPPRNAAPLRIDVGDFEILLDDSVGYAKKFADSGLSVSLHVWEGMPHGFQAIGTLQAADAVLKEVGAFLQSCLLQTHASA